MVSGESHTTKIHSLGGMRAMKNIQASWPTWMTFHCTRRKTLRESRNSRQRRRMLSARLEPFHSRTMTRNGSTTTFRVSPSTRIRQTQTRSLWITVLTRSTSGASLRTSTTRKSSRTLTSMPTPPHHSRATHHSGVKSSRSPTTINLRN